ncbi:MAG: DUF3592 domain-containing protein [Tildeniella nuda ZEHNDER 1965/U140]|jgi:hypothetical protein|nr:DUF3592 domain-containing protein [Tildeniella nuda ZEHNDER 1965/U140]
MQLRRNSIWQRIGYLVFPGGFIILSTSIGVSTLIQSFSNYQAAANFRNKSLSTTGIITETTTQTNTSPSGMAAAPSYVSTIQFETEQGKIAEFEAYNICQGYQLNLCSGKKVQVLYASDNPELSMIKGGSSPLDRARNNIGLGIFLILGGVMTFIIAATEYGGRFGPTRRN